MEVFMLQVKMKRLTDTAKLPEKATEFSAGYDLYADEKCVIQPKEYIAVSTGISMELPAEMEAQVRPRSGLAIKHGVTVLNAPGTIDADYRGEVKVILINHSNDIFLIEKGMRIAQMVFSKVEAVSLLLVDSLQETKRGCGGFGSTGTN